MKEQIQALIQLQDIDDQACMVKDALARDQEKLKSLKADQKEISGKVGVLKEEMQVVKKRQRELEAEIEDGSALAKRSRERLSSIKSNREYKALLREIDDGSKRISEMEEQVVDCMDELEQKQAELAELEEQYNAVSTSVEDEQADVDKKKKDVQNQLQKFEESRQALAKSVSPDILKRYKLILKNRNSKAMAAVVDSVCKACNMGIPPQTYNELQVGDKLMYCPHCERILYWKTDE